MLISVICVSIPGWHFRPNSNFQISKSKMEGPLCMPISKLWRGYRTNGNIDKLLVQTSLSSLTDSTLAWFTKTKISKIKLLTNLAYLFIKQYRFYPESLPTESNYNEWVNAKREFQRISIDMATDCFPYTTCSYREESVTIFVSTLFLTYYGKLIGHANASCANLVQTGECIADSLKTSKINKYQMYFE